MKRENRPRVSRLLETIVCSGQKKINPLNFIPSTHALTSAFSLHLVLVDTDKHIIDK
jgi:hypothetical protein